MMGELYCDKAIMKKSHLSLKYDFIIRYYLCTRPYDLLLYILLPIKLTLQVNWIYTHFEGNRHFFLNKDFR